MDLLVKVEEEELMMKRSLSVSLLYYILYKVFGVFSLLKRLSEALPYLL